MNSFYQLFIANIKMMYRDKGGLFWNIIIPLIIYSSLSVIPLRRVLGDIQYKNFLLPGMAAYIIMQGGIYSLAYWMVELRSMGVIKKLISTPIKIPTLVLSLILSRLSLMLVQISLLTLVGSLIFKAPFVGNYFSVFLITIIGGGIFLLIGLLIANYSTSYQTASPITAALGLPFTFLGNIFLPITLFPQGVQTLSKFLPIRYLSDAFRQAYLYEFNFKIIATDILILSIWLIAIFLLTVSVFKLKDE
jgi:ABC-2 type transport system permease protein